MAAPAKRIEISAGDRAALERIVRSRKAERRMVERARIVLEAGEGRSAAEIARRVGCSLATAKKWRARYERAGRPRRLRALERRPRAVVSLEDAPPLEVLDSLEITLATVKWRIYKAREEVQLALAREGITFGSDSGSGARAAEAAIVKLS